MALFGIGKRKTTRQRLKEERDKPGFRQFKRKFDGKTFRFRFFVPDKAHQGPTPGFPGSVEQLRKKARREGIQIRTIRRKTGWEVFTTR